MPDVEHWSVGPTTAEDRDQRSHEEPYKVVIYGSERHWPVQERLYYSTMGEALEAAAKRRWS